MTKLTRRSALPLLAAPAFSAPQLDVPRLNARLREITQGFDGRVGIAVRHGKQVASHLGKDRYSLQSVMKLFLGFAVCDQVDKGRMKLDAPITLYPQDRGVFHQPVAKLITAQGYRTSVAEIVRRAIIDSDNCAADVIVRLLGSAPVVTRALVAKGIQGIRIDRAERDLQTEILGIRWKPEFADPEVQEKAFAAVPAATRAAAFARYLKDERDTASPEACVDFLEQLHQGKLLSAASTGFLLQAMKDAVTGVDRLRAGLAPGWGLAHKTGTSGSWQGLYAATNDIGILYSPKGDALSIAVLVADSRAPEAERAAIIAKAAAAAISAFA
jgi:beta-lactamase class A